MLVVSLTENPEARKTMLFQTGGKKTVPQVMFGDVYIGVRELLDISTFNLGLGALVSSAGSNLHWTGP